MLNFIKIIVCTLFISFAFESKSQVQIDNAGPNGDPGYLVNEILTGGGVEISNITFGGTPVQIGYFSNGSSIIGVESGVLISTGDVTSMAGENTADATGSSTGSGSDVDLSTGGTDVNDVAALEFDFVPFSDTVEFKYVFASEEYNEYANSPYNDVFGFFISGPGITGSFAGGAKNIAKLPNGLPVSINTVNLTENPSYYVDNDYGDLTTTMDVGYDGFTVPLTAFSEVQCGETYHIKMVVGDVNDALYDSGVFFEAGSFGGSSVSFDATPTFTSYLGGNNIFEGCGEVALQFTREGDLSIEQTFDLTIGGTATSTTDYSNLPNTVTFPAGEDTVDFIINILEDNQAEAVETITIEFTDPTITCNNDITPLTIEIHDYPNLEIVTEGDTALCHDPSAEISVEVLTGLRPFTYRWNEGAVISESISFTNSYSVSPTSTRDYELIVTDACNRYDTVDLIEVYVPSPGFSLNAVNDTFTCFFDSIEIAVNVESALAGSNYTYEWSTGEVTSETESTSDAIFVNPTASSNYYVTVTESCEDISHEQLITVFVPYYDVEIIMSDSMVECRGDEITLDTNVFGGNPPYSIWWKSPAPDSGLGNVLTIDSASFYTFYATDQCAKDSGQITIEIKAPEAFEIEPIDDVNVYCPKTVVYATAVANGGSENYSFTWGGWDSLMSPDLNVSPLVTEEFVVQVADEVCFDTLTTSFSVIVPVYGDVVIEPIEPIIGCIDEEKEIPINVSGGTGIYTYNWSDGTTDSESKFVKLSEVDQQFNLIVTDECGNIDRTSVSAITQHPVANFEPSYYDVTEIEFKNLSSSDAIIYEWNFNDGSISSEYEPNYGYAQQGNYEVLLTVFNQYNCSHQVIKPVNSSVILWIPNTFTPNDDLKNEVWLPKHNGLNKYNLRILNRWGDELFITEDPTLGWDGLVNGAPAQQGVYQYVLTGIGKWDNEIVDRKGSLLLVR